MALGGGAIAIGAAVSLSGWFDAQQWQASPEAAQAQRNLAAPTPIWIDAASTPAPRPTQRAIAAAPVPTQTAPTAAPVAQPTPLPAILADTPTAEPAPTLEPTLEPTATLGPALLKLAQASFKFDDPPEPGATAHLRLEVHNPTDQAGGAITLALPADWLKGYRLEDSEPVVTQRQNDDRALQLTFDGPAAGEDLDLDLTFVTTDEVIDPPALTVTDALGREVGQARPPTEAPHARPGPVYSVDIPKLKLKTGVVQVDWEPPLFVVGQLKSSARVTQGNSVLVGHVRGAPGYNVFDKLDKLEPGDEITASSRGETYTFVVSQKQVLPEDDTAPTEPTDTPRLTLMTCAGEWNPITRDYNQRLWVVAEPAALAARTIALGSASPTPVVAPRFSPPGGLGNTDGDLSTAFGAPVGESTKKLAVYPSQGYERRALLMDTDPVTRRAIVEEDVLPRDAPLPFEDAVRLSRNVLPTDAEPRAAKPEGNQRYVVERFSSEGLAAVLPPEWFAQRGGRPGDFVVVYSRRPDGQITSVVIGIGDDAEKLLALL